MRNTEKSPTAEQLFEFCKRIALEVAAEEIKKNGQQKTASPEEIAERMATLRTQGRKGCRAVRINMAFTPENHEFIKRVARASGQTMTEFTNRIVEIYRREHPISDVWQLFVAAGGAANDL